MWHHLKEYFQFGPILCYKVIQYIFESGYDLKIHAEISYLYHIIRSVNIVTSIIFSICLLTCLLTYLLTDL